MEVANQIFFLPMCSGNIAVLADVGSVPYAVERSTQHVQMAHDLLLAAAKLGASFAKQFRTL